MWIHVDAAFDALLAAVGPRVPAHPFPFAFRAPEFAETALLPLVRREALALGSCLREGETYLFSARDEMHLML